MVSSSILQTRSQILGFTLDSKLQPQVYLKELAWLMVFSTESMLSARLGRPSAHLPPPRPQKVREDDRLGQDQNIYTPVLEGSAVGD